MIENHWKKPEACVRFATERDERISLLVTTFLAIVVFVLVVLEMVPEESDSVPLFCEFFLWRNPGCFKLNMT